MHRKVLILAGLASAVLLALLILFQPPSCENLARPIGETRQADHAPLPPLPSSPFRNTDPEASYVGSTACVDCHPTEHASYARTGMGRSLAELAAQREPPDATFTHEMSGRSYRIYRKDGELYHRETLVSDRIEHRLGDYPAQYVIGSGQHSRSYLMELDGFLVESPVTWYTSRQAWSMSPGYDVPLHSGFRREVPEKCLFCHAGRAQAVNGSLHRIEFLEHAIGCERCHGPGASHVQHHEAAASEGGNDSADGIDNTIVNPAHLSRDLAEDVCHQCHLTTKAYVPARGRELEDFRPGLPLKEFRHYFRERKPDSSMRVVGHVDQLMLSDCYRQSDTLSCLTCHNPHAFPEPEQREQYYRDICLQCHEQDSCRVSRKVLTERSPTNDCVKCHMPGTATNIPHLAFTHHRIGIHDNTPAAESDELSGFIELTPVHDLSFLSPLDRTRSLGLAYFALANRSATKREADEYMRRGSLLLTEVKEAGLQDGEVDAALAQAVWPYDRSGSTEHARDALRAPSLSAISRVNSLYALAASYRESQQHSMALPILKQLTTLRRNAGDWMLLGDCFLGSDDLREAIAAYEKAVEIDPNLVEIHELLAVCYERAGKPEQAQERRHLVEAIVAAMAKRAK